MFARFVATIRCLGSLQGCRMIRIVPGVELVHAFGVGAVLFCNRLSFFGVSVVYYARHINHLVFFAAPYLIRQDGFAKSFFE